MDMLNDLEDAPPIKSSNIRYNPPVGHGLLVYPFKQLLSVTNAVWPGYHDDPLTPLMGH